MLLRIPDNKRHKHGVCVRDSERKRECVCVRARLIIVTVEKGNLKVSE